MIPSMFWHCGLKFSPRDSIFQEKHTFFITPAYWWLSLKRVFITLNIGNFGIWMIIFTQICHNHLFSGKHDVFLTCILLLRSSPSEKDAYKIMYEALK